MTWSEIRAARRPLTIQMTHRIPTSRQVSLRLTSHPHETRDALSREEPVSGVAEMGRVHGEAGLRQWPTWLLLLSLTRLQI